ncbi:sugar ABC transporter permease [Fictibacillus phosphorivorans]|uniref:Sugar ABC transporter permease n=1 Tax=Fictibacillus phosphorivorans TaxID=1221500 RepID=A0A160IMI1_9BACL|nr:ABC transporter permease subunit [Fictibacillus phosphorivorans]ANC77364.1 sugar ABC transporter permease [Fictibacillus phosphorivorans]
MELLLNKEKQVVVVPKKTTRRKKIMRNWELYLFVLPCLLWFILFKYVPMYGIQLAFKQYIPTEGIWGSPWIGFQHFTRFFESYQFWTLIKNTLSLSLWAFIFTFPVPIIVALLLNQLTSERYKKFVQTVIYAPHFISTVVLVGILFVFLSPTSGIVNHLIVLFGGEPILFMARPEWFKPLYVISGLWQETGWATIIYLAALAGVSPALHEAAIMDGANKWQRIWHVDIPGIRPTIVILLILAIGNIMNIGFEKAYLMQTDLNKSASAIIPTYVYEIGLQRAQYSFAAAIGLFNSVINLIMLLLVNRIVRKLGGNSLW